MVLATASTELLDFQLLVSLRIDAFPLPTSPVSFADFLVSVLVTILLLSFVFVFPVLCYWLHFSSLWFPPVTLHWYFSIQLTLRLPIPPIILAPTASQNG